MQDNPLGDEGATFIADALKINKSLKHLNLSENTIGAIGVAAIAEALKINQSLKELYLTVSHTRKPIKRIKQTQTTQIRSIWKQCQLQKHWNSIPP